MKNLARNVGFELISANSSAGSCRLSLPHFFLVIRISAEDFTNESKSREEELPHEIPATPDDSDDERD